MSDVIWIDAVSTKPDSDLNRIGLSVSYQKGRGLVYTAYPGSERNGIIGVVITAGISRTIMAMPRDNKAKVNAAVQAAREHIRDRECTAWEMIQAVATKHSLMIPAVTVIS